MRMTDTAEDDDEDDTGLDAEAVGKLARRSKRMRSKNENSWLLSDHSDISGSDRDDSESDA